MVESVKELKKICAKPQRPNNVYIVISTYFTKIFLILNVNANQVSIIGFLLGAIASIFFISSNPLFYVIGGIFLFLVMVFDYCDGEIARYNKKEEGELGGFFDWFGHQSKFLVILCLTLGLIGFFPNYMHPYLLFLGFIFTFFWLLNHTFFGLRKNLSKIDKVDGPEKKIYIMISKTFRDNRIPRILFRFISFAIIFFKKFKIRSVDFSKISQTKKNSFFFRTRLIFRKSQSGRVIPFIFIFPGLFDYLLMNQLAHNYVTFFVWIYIGISGILIFIIEEYF